MNSILDIYNNYDKIIKLVKITNNKLLLIYKNLIDALNLENNIKIKVKLYEDYTKIFRYNKRLYHNDEHNENFIDIKQKIQSNIYYIEYKDKINKIIEDIKKKYDFFYDLQLKYYQNNKNIISKSMHTYIVYINTLKKNVDDFIIQKKEIQFEFDKYKKTIENYTDLVVIDNLKSFQTNIKKNDDLIKKNINEIEDQLNLLKDEKKKLELINKQILEIESKKTSYQDLKDIVNKLISENKPDNIVEYNYDKNNDDFNNFIKNNIIRYICILNDTKETILLNDIFLQIYKSDDDNDIIHHINNINKIDQLIIINYKILDISSINQDTAKIQILNFGTITNKLSIDKVNINILQISNSDSTEYEYSKDNYKISLKKNILFTEEFDTKSNYEILFNIYKYFININLYKDLELD